MTQRGAAQPRSSRHSARRGRGAVDGGNHRVRGAYDSTRTGSSQLERARKRYWDEDGHRTEQDRIADRVWDVLDKYDTIEEDEHGFDAGCAGNLRSDIRYRRGEGAIADPTEILATRKDQGTTVHSRDQ